MFIQAQIVGDFDEDRPVATTKQSKDVQKQMQRGPNKGGGTEVLHTRMEQTHAWNTQQVTKGWLQGDILERTSLEEIHVDLNGDLKRQIITETFNRKVESRKTSHKALLAAVQNNVNYHPRKT